MDKSKSPKSFRLPAHTIEKLDGLIEAGVFRTATEIVVVGVENISLMYRMKGHTNPPITLPEAFSFLIENEKVKTLELFQTYGDEGRKNRILQMLDEVEGVLSSDPKDVCSVSDVLCRAYTENYEFEMREQNRKMYVEDLQEKKLFYEELNREFEKINSSDLSQDEKDTKIAKLSRDLLKKYHGRIYLLKDDK